MSGLDLQRLEPGEWSALLARSPQRTRFLDPAFLAIFGADIRFHGLLRKGVCALGLPVIDPRALGVSTLPWCYKQGPVFHEELSRGAIARRVQHEVELAEAGVTALAAQEPWFRLSLHESLTDVRGYDWVHYHDPGKARCTLLPRYTAVVPVAGLDAAGLRAAARSARRQEEGYARRREDLDTAVSGSVDDLLALYLETFARQGQVVSGLERDLLRPYVDHFRSRDAGEILTVCDASGRAVAAAFVFRDYDDVWHVPVIGTSDTRYGGTLLYFHILDHVRARGGRAVDFDGANSPNRAYFKHSLGAEPVLYFELRYEAANG